jgi:hypothetical protein
VAPVAQGDDRGLYLVVAADVHETLDEPEAGLDPAIPIASTAGIEAVADMTVEPVVVVMVAMVMVAVVVMAVMATFAAALASESNAGSEHDQGGSDTKSSLTEHLFSPVTDPVRYQSRPIREWFTRNKSRSLHMRLGTLSTSNST